MRKRKLATAASMSTAAEIEAVLVRHSEVGGVGSITLSYKDPTTQCSFLILGEESDESLNDEFQTRYFLSEYIPNGILVEVNDKGAVIGGREEPLIKALETKYGPNDLMKQLRAHGVAIDKMAEHGGGYTVGAIYYSTVGECVEAIAKALADNCRYQHWRELTEQEKIKRERMEAEQSHLYWQAENAACSQSFADEDGLFKGCYTMMGTQLTDESKLRILSYINKPSQQAWLDVRSIMIAGVYTLWQAWCEADPSAPRSGDKGFPSPSVVIDCIRAIVEKRASEVKERGSQTSPTGLRVVC